MKRYVTDMQAYYARWISNIPMRQMLAYRKASRLELEQASQGDNMAHSQIPTPTRTPSTGTGTISRSSSLSSHQSLSRTASLSSVPTPPTWLQSHSNSRAAYAQARGFDLVDQIHASLQKQVDSRGLAAATSRSATPAQSSPEESPEARAERLDREDLAAVNAEVDQYFSEPCEDKRTDPLVYWQVCSHAWNKHYVFDILLRTT